MKKAMSEPRCFNPLPTSAEDWLPSAATENPNADGRACGRLGSPSAEAPELDAPRAQNASLHQQLEVKTKRSAELQRPSNTTIQITRDQIKIPD